MGARLFAVLGTILIAGGLANEIYEIPVRVPQFVSAIIIAVGGLCLMAFLVLGERERRDSA